MAKGVADIVFVVDATGSMQSCIDALKDNISSFVESLTHKDANNTCPVKDFRAKVVGYRDFEYSDYEAFIDNPFVRDAGELRRQLDNLEAAGGGDEPESLLDALYRVCVTPATDKGNLQEPEKEDPFKWRYRSNAVRIVIVFTDASYKETMSAPEIKGGGLQDLFNVIMSNRIVLHIFAPEMECYDELSAVDKSNYNEIPLNGKKPAEALKDYTSDPARFQKVLQALAASVSKSAETEVL